MTATLPVIYRVCNGLAQCAVGPNKQTRRRVVAAPYIDQQKSEIKVLLRFKAAFVLLLLRIALLAQTNPQMAAMNDTIEMMRSLVSLERKAISPPDCRMCVGGQQEIDGYRIFDLADKQ